MGYILLPDSPRIISINCNAVDLPVCIVLLSVNLNNFPLISLSGIFSINGLTLILENIGQCDVTL